MRIRLLALTNELLRKVFTLMSLILSIIYIALVALDMFIIYLEIRFATFKNLLLFRLTLTLNGLPTDVRAVLTSTYRNGLKTIRFNLKDLLRSFR